MNGYSRAIPAAEGNVEQQLQALRTQLRLVQEETEDMLRTLKDQVEAAEQRAQEQERQLEAGMNTLQQTVQALVERVTALETANG